jgi:adenylosuccinate synthase
MSDKLVIYGGQYGSEGKASASEYWIKQLKTQGKVLVIGENSPNSGHTSSLGSTKNIPAASFWADAVLLGPDAVVDPTVLIQDWEKVGKPPLFIHENAALLDGTAKVDESDLVKRISSTGSGSGMARKRKFIERHTNAVVKGYPFPPDIQVVDRDEYEAIVKQTFSWGMIMECSQGVLLDTNFGIYPFVTSRSTLPRVAVERNGLGWIPWTFVGVYRTYPIRTGGPSGPTGAGELSWASLGQKQEIATVTKRIRRIFEFSFQDFCRSLRLSMPDILMFTFLDYIGVSSLKNRRDFDDWLLFYDMDEVDRYPVYVSNKTGKFVKHF